MARTRFHYRSRLSRKEGQRYARQTFIFSFLTLLLIAVLLFWGIPSLVKLAVFLGDLRSSSQPVSSEDAVPPTVPILRPSAPATNSATLRISGFSEDGTTVVLSINGSDTHEVLVEANGEFLFDSVSLQPGENTISARSVDKAGNASRSSADVRVIYDNALPSLTVDSPQDRASFVGSSEKVLRVSGTSESDSVVRINGLFAILSTEGGFSSSLTLSPGDNTITVTASDRAGNETVVTRTVSYEE